MSKPCIQKICISNQSLSCTSQSPSSCLNVSFLSDYFKSGQSFFFPSDLTMGSIMGKAMDENLKKNQEFMKQMNQIVVS